MLKWLIRRRIAAFERAFDYDMSYARTILEADPGALFAIARIRRLTENRSDLPRDVHWAVKLVATQVEDCGPCVQLLVTQALREDVSPGLVACVLAGREADLPPDVALAVHWARSAAARDESDDGPQEAVIRRFGEEGLVALALAFTASRLFPILKYALGHGRACARIVVGETTLALGQAGARPTGEARPMNPTHPAKRPV